MLLALVVASHLTWRGVRLLPATGDHPALRWRISNRTLDLSNATLLGSRSERQETYSGVGVLLDHCSNLTIRGIAVHGYRINLLLDGCRNVRIEDADLDKSHAEPIVDRYGQVIDKFLNLRGLNDWRGYGAGVWLQNCAGCKVVRCQAGGAMTGLVLQNSRKSKVYDNDFSYNSAWGVALWQSDQNVVNWNHADFCNRPWGGGWGGDSAGFAIVGSSGNAFVGNSITHGGDGFFLSDLVQGGWSDIDKRLHESGTSDNNLVVLNDGSWSPHNAFEGTFSVGNSYLANRADDSDYGFWLGYSSRSAVRGNSVERETNDGIAIEHGRDNRISFNSIRNCRGAGIRLWNRAGPDVGVAPSTRNLVTNNAVVKCGSWLEIPGSTATTVSLNRQSGDPLVPVLPPNAAPLVAERPAGWRFYRDEGKPVGYEWIQPAKYAPWPNRVWAFTRVTNASYKVWLGPGTQGLEAPEWVQIDKVGRNLYSAHCDERNAVGKDFKAKITTRSAQGAFELVSLPFRTGGWTCEWFTWSNLPFSDLAGWRTLFASAPAASTKLDRLNADWSYRSPLPGVLPNDHFALLANRSFDFEGGSYHFYTTSDDGIRLLLDDREIISRWDHHASMDDRADVNVSPGVHKLRVEYCQEDGAAVLRVNWARI